MLKNLNDAHSWKESLAAAKHRQVLNMLLLGFSAGLPILLIFSSLSLWLREAGIEKSAVTYFSWAALGYSFKFVWAPLVDCLPIPVLTRRLGLRRSWLLVSQLGVMLAITLMAYSNPEVESQLMYMAMGAVLLGFSSATQDITIDAYRIEAANADMQGMMTASYVTGYRLGMIVAGAGALYLASYLGTRMDAYSYDAWKLTYHSMSLFMLVGIITTLAMQEPINRVKTHAFLAQDYLRLVLSFALSVMAFIACFWLSAGVVDGLKAFFEHANFSNFLLEVARLLFACGCAFWVAKLAIKLKLVERKVIEVSYLLPIKSFFENYGMRTAWLLLALIGLYRISDIVLGVISTVFYQDMGFSKTEIADAVKVFGLIMTIVGAFLGGILAMRIGVMKILFIGALLVVLTNLLFIVLVYSGHNLHVLYFVVAADNLVAGIATSAFIAFLSSLIDVRFTAMQYAMFSSLMTLIPKLLAGYSGGIVDSLGYTSFFVIASCIGLPVLILVYLANKSLNIRQRT
ncbi:MAG: MFS transporter [Bermanella sp.]